MYGFIQGVGAKSKVYLTMFYAAMTSARFIGVVKIAPQAEAVINVAPTICVALKISSKYKYPKIALKGDSNKKIILAKEDGNSFCART